MYYLFLNFYLNCKLGFYYFFFYVFYVLELFLFVLDIVLRVSIVIVDMFDLG